MGSVGSSRTRSLLRQRGQLRDPRAARVARIQIALRVHRHVSGLAELAVAGARSIADRAENVAAHSLTAIGRLPTDRPRIVRRPYDLSGRPHTHTPARATSPVA